MGTSTVAPAATVAEARAAAPPPAPAVRFSGVSKRFELNRSSNRSLVDLPGRVVGRQPKREYFWPLRDVSFEVQRGVTVGLIGENGAGKSTLLKLITRILEPTSGEVQIGGRVSALLELGAGFHPELTGRENIALHCSLLGMNRAQTAAIVDNVIAFADIGSFIDTPVKHYSSGMYARLGFAIAIHVQPDILLVDEVLAVGDEAFQRRCLDVIQDLRAGGATIVFVSHSLQLVLSLCDDCIWLDEGGVRAHGPAPEVVRAYLRAVDNETAQRLIAENALDRWIADDEGDGPPLQRPPRRWGRGPITINRVEMVDAAGAAGWSFEPLAPLAVRIAYTAAAPVSEPVFSVLIHHHDGRYLWASNTMDHPVGPIATAGNGALTVALDGLALTAGRYLLSAAAYPEPDAPWWGHPSDFHEQIYEFQVTSEREIHGDVVMPTRWSHEPPNPAHAERARP